MSFIRNIFGNKDTAVTSYSDFWNWFQDNEKTFFTVVKEQKDIEQEFFEKLSPKLAELKDGYFYLTGMLDENTVDLVFTADGNTKNIVFIEELVEQAPKIEGWKFTANKPATNIDHIGIRMGGYTFDSSNLFFYSNDYPEYPDEIDISIIHDDRTEENKEAIGNGTYIFLDNYLGELAFLNSIDNFTFISKEQAEKELVPISKLKDFLIWREKEFVEKYEGLRYDTENDSYSSFEAELKNGRPLVAIVNSTLLNWDSKASHPWILSVEIEFDGENSNGLPDRETFEFLNDFEDEIMLELKDVDGYLNIGRQTADGLREIYFACIDFRKPSKVLHDLSKKYANKLKVNYEIYKDKYWQSFERFRPN
ncbi:DUF695 domain-containing protein [Sphingobacterium hungaricum]|uniref:DUF695 domain-containing protein n=1 Tax=Sphingobacterium hungaricum TaxID=2082723 RepID=A0A928UVN3_9SPHI|nr:DUF695 domain-containing protein [Sphingobacterium hungaricum]MBE8712145.1 DUF695 domain-containing protein [Sphingobacterium hungaricum]